MSHRDVLDSNRGVERVDMLAVTLVPWSRGAQRRMGSIEDELRPQHNALKGLLLLPREAWG